MEITTVTRKISGHNFDNLSFTANLVDGEPPDAAAVTLDRLCHQALERIYAEQEKSREIKQEANEAVNILEEALRHAKGRANEVPF